MKPVVVFLALILSAQAQKITTLHAFKGGLDGNYPVGVTLDAQGNIYGTTTYGGAANKNGLGVVFKLVNKKETIIRRFNSRDGKNPLVGLIEDAGGNFYGTTFQGGAYGGGTIFKVANGVESVIYSFTGHADGGYPRQGLALDSAGTLYGSSGSVHDRGPGVIFKLDTQGNFTPLYIFNETISGASSNLVLDQAGNLYGEGYGGRNSGLMFKIDPQGQATVLYTFAGGSDGSFPQGNLAVDAAGNLYGTTRFGGALGCPLNGSDNGCGTVFEVTPNGEEVVLYRFAGTNGDAKNPTTGVILDAAGNLYGTTSTGGASDLGAIYELSQGKERVLHSFSFKNDKAGQYPQSDLAIDLAGNLYGTTSSGGNLNFCGGNGCGTVFELTPK